LKHKQHFVLGLLFTVNITVLYASVQLTVQKILPSRPAMSAQFCNVLAGWVLRDRTVFLLRVTEVLVVGTASRHLVWNHGSFRNKLFVWWRHPTRSESTDSCAES